MNIDYNKYYEYTDNKNNPESSFYSSFIHTLPLDVQNYINQIKTHYSLYLLHIKLLMKLYVNGVKQLDNTYIPLPRELKLKIYSQILEYNKIINVYEKDLQKFIGYNNFIWFLLETQPAKIKYFNTEEMFTYFNNKYKFSKGIDQTALNILSFTLLITGKFEEYFILNKYITTLPSLFNRIRF